MRWYVWFYGGTYRDGNVETGYLRSNADEAATVAAQLYDYFGEGYKIKGLQFNGEIIDVSSFHAAARRAGHED